MNASLVLSKKTWTTPEATLMMACKTYNPMWRVANPPARPATHQPPALSGYRPRPHGEPDMDLVGASLRTLFEKWTLAIHPVRCRVQVQWRE